MATGVAPPVFVLNSWSPLPEVEILPIVLAPESVNQRLPSGPAVMPTGSLTAVWEIPVGRNSVIVPGAAASAFGPTVTAKATTWEATTASATSCGTVWREIDLRPRRPIQLSFFGAVGTVASDNQERARRDR